MTSTTDTVPQTALPDARDIAVPAPESLAQSAGLASPPVVRWSFVTRLAFRFFAVYFTAYILCTQMYFSLLRWPWGQLPSLGANSYVRNYATWIATSWFGVPSPLSNNGGSGDKPYDFALAFGLVLVSLALTIIWSVLDRRRPNYVRLHAWMRVLFRFGLGGTMITYGMIKAFPLQMSYPSLMRLLEPYGHFSLMGVLWAKIGSSPSYEMLTGFAELAAGIMLFIPGLTTLAALFTLGVTAQIFTLNMTYDVPVKLFSLHLVVLSLLLLAPDIRRLLSFAVLKRQTDPPVEAPLLRSRMGRRVAIVLQLMLGTWIVWSAYQAVSQQYQASAWVAPRPPLYGIWVIDRMSIDGIERAPLVTDYDRWRRLVIQSGASITFQRMDDTFQSYQAKYDVPGATIVVNAANKEIGRFTIQQPAEDRLILDGSINGRPLRMETTLYDRNQFELVRGRFRWFQNTPWNR